MDFGRKSFAAIAAATVLLAGAGRLSGQGGTITGRVTSQATGQPLAEARVLGIQTTLAATTGEDGRFTLRNVPPGAVQLQVLRVELSVLFVQIHPRQESQFSYL